MNQLWEYAKEVYTCFVNLETAYDCVPRDKLWVVLEHDVRGQLLAAIKSFYKQSEVCVRVNGMKTKPFNVSVGLRQGCVLSPFLCITYMDKIDKNSSSSSGVTFGKCNLRRLLFADDFALLTSNKSNFQYALDRFPDTCLNAGMKISTAKTEITCLSMHSVQCSFQINEITLNHTEKFKYLGVTFLSVGRQDNELDTRIGKVSAVMRQFSRSVLLKRELCTKANLSVFRSVFVPILTYGHDCWEMTKRVRSQVQAAEMSFLRKVRGLSLLDKVKSSDICQSLNIELLLLCIEQSQVLWYSHGWIKLMWGL